MKTTPPRGSLRGAVRKALRFVAGVISGSSLLLVAGCGSQGTEGLGGEAQVRYVQVAPNVPDADLWINGAGAAYGLSFESFTSYLPLSAGQTMLEVHHAGASRAFLSAQRTFLAGHQYTAVLSETAGVPQQYVFQDGTMAAPAGRVAIRVINAVQGLPALAVHVGPADEVGMPETGSMLQVREGAATAYLDLPSSTPLQVAVTLPGSGLTVPLATLTVRAGSGAVRTVLLAGAAHREGRSHVVAFALPDVDPPV